MKFTRACSAAAIVLAVGSVGFASTSRFYYRQLGSFPGGRTQSAGLNNAGNVTGSSGDFNFGFHAFTSDTSAVLTNIDTLGCDDSEPVAINAVGQIAIHGGWNHGGNNWTIAVLRYTPGVGLENLGAPAGFNGQIAAINIHGDIVGRWYPASGQSRPFHYSDAGGMEYLPDLGGFGGVANDINDAGLIVGSVYDTNDVEHAVIWQNGVLQDLGLGQAVATNNAGMVTGYTSVGSDLRAFYWTSASGLQVIPVPAAARNSFAAKINQNGTILGYWLPNSVNQYAFLYTPGQGRVDLQLPSGMLGMQPWALNDLGHVVGVNFDPNYEPSAFYYAPELGVVDINTLISPPLTWWGMQPIAINDNDEILINAGGGTNDAHSAILAPVHLGDMNCDGRTDFADINPFVLALSDPAAYQTAQPRCFIQSGDINGDGAVDFYDINPFVALLSGN